MKFSTLLLNQFLGAEDKLNKVSRTTYYLRDVEQNTFYCDENNLLYPHAQHLVKFMFVLHNKEMYSANNKDCGYFDPCDCPTICRGLFCTKTVYDQCYCLETLDYNDGSFQLFPFTEEELRVHFFFLLLQLNVGVRDTGTPDHNTQRMLEVACDAFGDVSYFVLRNSDLTWHLTDECFTLYDVLFPLTTRLDTVVDRRLMEMRDLYQFLYRLFSKDVVHVLRKFLQ